LERGDLGNEIPLFGVTYLNLFPLLKTLDVKNLLKPILDYCAALHSLIKLFLELLAFDKVRGDHDTAPCALYDQSICPRIALPKPEHDLHQDEALFAELCKLIGYGRRS
jgi:hypothetical protein